MCIICSDDSHLNWAVKCDFQQCGILTWIDSNKPVQPPFKRTNSKCRWVSSLSHRIFKQLAKALIILRVCSGWSEALLVAHTTLLEISCRGSLILFVLSYCFSVQPTWYGHEWWPANPYRMTKNLQQMTISNFSTCFQKQKKTCYFMWKICSDDSH